MKPGKYAADWARVNVIVVEPTATGVTTPVEESIVATAVFELDHEAVPVLVDDGAVAVNAPSTSRRLPIENDPNEESPETRSTQQSSNPTCNSGTGLE